MGPCTTCPTCPGRASPLCYGQKLSCGLVCFALKGKGTSRMAPCLVKPLSSPLTDCELLAYIIFPVES